MCEALVIAAYGCGVLPPEQQGVHVFGWKGRSHHLLVLLVLQVRCHALAAAASAAASASACRALESPHMLGALARCCHHSCVMACMPTIKRDSSRQLGTCTGRALRHGRLQACMSMGLNVAHLHSTAPPGDPHSTPAQVSHDKGRWLQAQACSRATCAERAIRAAESTA